MTQPQSNDPLRGITLDVMLTRLVEHYGWEELGTGAKRQEPK